jgi:hypothetical protein
MLAASLSARSTDRQNFGTRQDDTMTNRLEHINIPASLLRFERRDSQEKPTTFQQHKAAPSHTGDALSLEGPTPEQLERPLSRRIGDPAQALAAIERLRRQATEDPASLLASHTPDGRTVDALLRGPHAPAS